MSRTVRILTMTAGSALLFTLFAIAGWAITDQLASDDQAGEDTVAMFSYPLVPVQGDEESTLEWIEEQQAFTAEAMAGPNDPDAFLGDAIAGGQTIRVIPEISLPDTDVAETPPTTINDGGAAEPGSVSPEPGGGEVADGAIPGDLFADAPWLIDRIDLSDIVIFDGFLEPLDIDLCAGSDAVPSIPAGCPTGFGGTIVPLSGDLPASDDEVGGRPPTGLTAFGPDTLYVRTFRRSSVPEQWSVPSRFPPETQGLVSVTRTLSPTSQKSESAGTLAEPPPPLTRVGARNRGRTTQRSTPWTSSLSAWNRERTTPSVCSGSTPRRSRS